MRIFSSVRNLFKRWRIRQNQLDNLRFFFCWWFYLKCRLSKMTRENLNQRDNIHRHTHTQINQWQLLNKSKSLFMFQNQCKITWQSINNKLDVRHIYACVKIYGFLSRIFDEESQRIQTADHRFIVKQLQTVYFLVYTTDNL